MTTNIDRAVHVINETYADEYVKPHMTPPKVATALDAAALLSPDLPKPDRDGLWWPERGRNYGHVRVETIHDPRLNTTDRGNLDPFKGVTIARGGPGYASRYTSMTLTKDEALELASILIAAAMEEA